MTDFLKQAAIFHNFDINFRDKNGVSIYTITLPPIKIYSPPTNSNTPINSLAESTSTNCNSNNPHKPKPTRE